MVGERLLGRGREFPQAAERLETKGEAQRLAGGGGTAKSCVCGLVEIVVRGESVCGSNPVSVFYPSLRHHRLRQVQISHDLLHVIIRRHRDDV